MSKESPLLTDSFDLHKIILDKKFREAKAEGKVLWPDTALKELFDWWTNVINSDAFNSKSQKSKLIRVNEAAILKKVHMYAVELFYKTYFSTIGAPKLTDEYLARILELYEEKKSYRKVALELEPELSKQELENATEKIRKQVKLAQKKLKTS